jgi:hypothetical protein
MADLYGTFSSLLQKLKSKPHAEPAHESEAGAATQSPQDSEPVATEEQLAALSDAELEALAAELPERSITRLLNSISDPELQLKIVQSLRDEAALKRIGRSELSARLKRAAEKRLGDFGDAGMEKRLQKLVPLSEKLRAFIKSPDWTEAHELLAQASDPDLLDETDDQPIDETHAIFIDFTQLRERVAREVEAYEKTCAEMEDVCLELDAARTLSKADVARIEQRWLDLSEKYKFPEEFDVPTRYAELLAAKQSPRVLTGRAPGEPAPTPPPVDPAIEERKLKQKAAQEEQRQAQAKARITAVEALLKRTKEIEPKLAERQSGPELRKLQNEAAKLRRWKREYPAQLTEIEKLLKDLTNQRTKVLDEARWDTWARTDKAVRMQAQLEETITKIEVETDPITALQESLGLTAMLQAYAREMRSLGSLERGKDHKIWKQFKALSDRGWAVCDRMRGIVLEGFKAILSQHLVKPIEFTLEALADPRTQIQFRPTAYVDPVPAQIKEIRMMWLEIGTKPTGANRALEAVFSKLFESYTRQMNMALGRVQKVETNKAQAKRDILKEMKLTAEGASTLVSRAMVAKRLEERWKSAPMPATGEADLQGEFEGYQAKIQAQVAEEVGKQATRVADAQTRAQAVLDQLEARSSGIAPALKTLAGIEAELAGIEKHVAQFGARGSDTTAPARAVIAAGREVATRETRERASARDQVLAEAQGLALSSDWDAARARFEELAALWKKTGAVGEKQDALYGAFFENAHAFFKARLAAKDRATDAMAQAKALKARTDLVYSLETLTRFRKVSSPLALPFSEEELKAAPSKLLQLGFKYNQILSLDPAAGAIKETRKIMEEWVKTAPAADTRLAADWTYYLDRVRLLLELK